MEDKSQKPRRQIARRRKEAKRRRQRRPHPDLSAWLTIIVFLIVGPAAIDNLRGLFVRTLGQVRAIMDEPSVPRLTEIFRDGMLRDIWYSAPLALG
ncbi:MAG: hypothetical protein IPI32_08720 [Austwickia sp.]|nr:hypothetical protein [Austwickia sp.]